MTSSTLRIRPDDAWPVPVLRLSGSLELPAVPALMRALTETLTGPTRVAVCDVGELQVLQQAHLAAFPAALRRAGGWPRASLHLAGAAPTLDQALRRNRIHRYLPLHPDLGQAVEVAVGQVRAGEVRELVLPGRPDSLRAARAALPDNWLDDTAGPTRRSSVPGPRSGAGDPRTEGGVPAAIQAARIVVTELASNAIMHVGTPFTLTLAPGPAGLTLAVTDDGPGDPVLRPPRASSLRGRGLAVISALSREWGVRLVHPTGKTVWADMPITGPAPR